MRVSAWPKFLATTINGMPFMTAWLAHECLVIWKLAGGVIRARAEASAIGRTWWFLSQGLPSALVNTRSVPARPAQTDLKNRAPSSVSTAWWVFSLPSPLRERSHQLDQLAVTGTTQQRALQQRPEFWITGVNQPLGLSDREIPDARRIDAFEWFHAAPGLVGVHPATLER
jgi:hypothetical protein